MRNADYCSVLSEVKDTLKKITEHRGDVFGNSEKECENCYSLNLASAKEISRKYLEILNNSVNTGAYEE